MGCNCGKNKGRNLRVTTQNKSNIVKSTDIKLDNIEQPVEQENLDKNLPLLDNSKNPLKNLINAAKTQNNKIKWFKDGVSGIVKCLTEDIAYTDEDIQKNRDICRECPHSTKGKNNTLTMTSQCMGINPDTGEVCGCFILCKTQNGECPLSKWSTIKITIEKNDI